MISLICEKYNITNYTINGNVWLYKKGLTELPLTFNRVTGFFNCDDNRLTTLKGCPRWIGGYFDCGNNRLTSLEFSPDYVGTWFNCSNNDLTDNYCDTEIMGKFYTSLKQDGLTMDNYNEWRKLYKRKQILNELYTRHM